ncbi:Hypothetical predicted protein [Olea europaea subsp. europaea]|uniref:Uncharacterized protein n=1 Tax=Olea europaea subsp. europaea TaxID=158383 RepID=A0A8S0U364_OLEEU|nr:Hypothetical predicted protein [Olea europaea subsp. europaea]
MAMVAVIVVEQFVTIFPRNLSSRSHKSDLERSQKVLNLRKKTMISWVQIVYEEVVDPSNEYLLGNWIVDSLANMNFAIVMKGSNIPKGLLQSGLQTAQVSLRGEEACKAAPDINVVLLRHHISHREPSTSEEIVKDL